VISAVLAGDPHQFEVLVLRYQNELFRVARSRLGRTDWAEDAVQESFLCAFKSIHSYDSRYSFRTWMWTILLNQCRRLLKKRARNLFVRPWSDHLAHRGDDDLGACLLSDETPADQLLALERTQLLDTLLRRLPETQADALRLRFFGSLKFREIADAMGCSLSTAKNRVRWGLAKMAQHLEPDRVLESEPVSEDSDERPDNV